MMSTYELAVAFLSSNSILSSSSTTEVTTIQIKKVSVNHVDSEANAVTSTEL
jgi:hypothetical protein